MPGFKGISRNLSADPRVRRAGNILSSNLATDGLTGGAGGTGFTFTFSSTTTTADPGSGKFRLNAVIALGPTELYISETDGDGFDVSSWISSWTGSQNFVKGYVTVRNVTGSGYLLLAVVSNVTDSGTWDKLTIAVTASAGVFTDGDECTLSFVSVPPSMDGVTIVQNLSGFYKVSTPALGTGTPSTTTYLRGDGTWSAPTVGASIGNRTLAYAFNGSDPWANTIVSSTTETSIVSVSIPGGTLGFDNVVRVRIWGDFLNTSGSTATLTLRAKYGATTCFDDATSLLSSGNRRPVYIEFLLHNYAASTSAQALFGQFLLGSNVAAGTVGRGDIGATGAMSPVSGGATVPTIAEDSTLAKTFAVTLQFSVSNSTTAFRLMGYTVTVESPTGPVDSNGNIVLTTAGQGVKIKEGTNATMGVATLVAGTVTVSTTKVTASSRILLTTQSLGTVVAPKAIAVTARVAGTSFTITSADATDTSSVAWQIVEPA